MQRLSGDLEAAQAERERLRGTLEREAGLRHQRERQLAAAQQQLRRMEVRGGGRGWRARCAALGAPCLFACMRGRAVAWQSARGGSIRAGLSARPRRRVLWVFAEGGACCRPPGKCCSCWGCAGVPQTFILLFLCPATQVELRQAKEGFARLDSSLRRAHQQQQQQQQQQHEG